MVGDCDLKIAKRLPRTSGTRNLTRRPREPRRTTRRSPSYGGGGGDGDSFLPDRKPPHRAPQEPARRRAPERTKQYVEHDWWHRRLSESGADMIPVNAFCVLRDNASGPRSTRRTSRCYEQRGRCARSRCRSAARWRSAVRARRRQAHAQARDARALVRRRCAQSWRVDRAELLPCSSVRATTVSTIATAWRTASERLSPASSSPNVAYGCQVVVTNPTSTPRTLDAPADPRARSRSTRARHARTHDLQLAPFATSRSSSVLLPPPARSAQSAQSRQPARLSRSRIRRRSPSKT